MRPVHQLALLMLLSAVLLAEPTVQAGRNTSATIAGFDAVFQHGKENVTVGNRRHRINRLQLGAGRRIPYRRRRVKPLTFYEPHTIFYQPGSYNYQPNSNNYPPSSDNYQPNTRNYPSNSSYYKPIVSRFGAYTSSNDSVYQPVSFIYQPNSYNYQQNSHNYKPPINETGSLRVSQNPGQANVLQYLTNSSNDQPDQPETILIQPNSYNYQPNSFNNQPKIYCYQANSLNYQSTQRSNKTTPTINKPFTAFNPAMNETDKANLVSRFGADHDPGRSNSSSRFRNDTNYQPHTFYYQPNSYNNQANSHNYEPPINQTGSQRSNKTAAPINKPLTAFNLAIHKTDKAINLVSRFGADHDPGRSNSSSRFRNDTNYQPHSFYYQPNSYNNQANSHNYEPPINQTGLQRSNKTAATINKPLTAFNPARHETDKAINLGSRFRADHDPGRSNSSSRFRNDTNYQPHNFYYQPNSYNIQANSHNYEPNGTSY